MTQRGALPYPPPGCYAAISNAKSCRAHTRDESLSQTRAVACRRPGVGRDGGDDPAGRSAVLAARILSPPLRHQWPITAVQARREPARPHDFYSPALTALGCTPFAAPDMPVVLRSRGRLAGCGRRAAQWDHRARPPAHPAAPQGMLLGSSKDRIGWRAVNQPRSGGCDAALSRICTATRHGTRTSF